MKKQYWVFAIILIIIAFIFIASYPAPTTYADRSEFIKANPDFRDCNQDSDCTLVKDCPDLCLEQPINKKYEKVWENIPLSEEAQKQCILRESNPFDGCKIVSYGMACWDNKCVAIGE